ncbi:hypothetical protein HK101_007024 [Irineochytrium annulatum]|nr:hypothetical protein HK101_007024 [Irineochytrium annulatum]
MGDLRKSIEVGGLLSSFGADILQYLQSEKALCSRTDSVDRLMDIVWEQGWTTTQLLFILEAIRYRALGSKREMVTALNEYKGLSVKLNLEGRMSKVNEMLKEVETHKKRGQFIDSLTEQLQEARRKKRSNAVYDLLIRRGQQYRVQGMMGEALQDFADVRRFYTDKNKFDKAVDFYDLALQQVESKSARAIDLGLKGARAFMQTNEVHLRLQTLLIYSLVNSQLETMKMMLSVYEKNKLVNKANAMESKIRTLEQLLEKKKLREEVSMEMS